MYNIENEKINFHNENFPIVISLGKSYTGSDIRFHEEIEIKFVNSGQLTVMIGTDAVTAVEGEIVFINPYEVHSNLCVDGNAGTYDLIMLDLDFFNKAGVGGINLRKIISEQRVCFKNIIKNNKAAEVMRRLTQNRSIDTEFDKLYVSGLLIELFAILLQSETMRNDKVAGDERVKFFRAIEPAVSRIRENYSEKLLGETLAEMCSMSKYYFGRVFKRVMGVTPVQYQTECRLHVADVLLKDRTLSISEIAAQTGFEDEAYFSRCYKKHRGVSPKAMRAKLSK